MMWERHGQFKPHIEEKWKEEGKSSGMDAPMEFWEVYLPPRKFFLLFSAEIGISH
jgi:hypothetical protein